MKSHSLATLRTVVAAVCGIGLAMGVVVPRAQADQWDKKTVLTVNQPIQVRDKLLEPGKYVFKLLDSSSNRHIVQIFNGDQSRIIDTVLAIPNYRLEPTGDSRFAFWETPPGNAKALRAWFYPGDNFGQEFPYPKQLIRLEASVTTAPAAPRSQSEASEADRAETPVTQPAETAAVSEPETTPVEVAQAAPPPTTASPPPPVVEPSAERAAPEELPKTASLYPLIGLSGLFFLGLYSLLRLKRQA